MTSKTCSNGALVRENLRRFWWVSALYFIALFFVIPFRLLISLDSIKNELLWAAERAAELGVPISEVYTYDLFNFTGGLEAVAFIIVPVFIAGLLYSYMNKRKSIDTIHALPIKRTKLFSLNALSGVIIYTLPLVATCIISAIAISIAGLWPYVPVSLMFLWLIQSVLYLSVFFAIACFFSVLSGNVLVMAILTYIFSALPVILYGAVSGTLSLWMYGYDFSGSISDIWIDISPGSYVFKSAMSGIDPAASPLPGILYLVFALVMFLLACLLYKKRRSENTASTIAFGAAKPIIKYILSVLFAILFGSVIYFIANRENAVQLIIGYLVGAAIAYLILHAVIHRDIRAIKTGKAGLIILLIVIFGASMALTFDVTGYQKRVPEAGEVTAVYFDPFGYNNSDARIGTGYQSPESIELIRKIHQSCVDAKFNSHYSLTLDRTETPPLYERTPDTPSVYPEDQSYYTINTLLRYDLGGRELTRRYTLTPEAYETYLPELLATEEGKRNTFVILNEEMFVYPGKLSISDNYGVSHEISDPAQVRLVIDALKRDILEDPEPFTTKLQEPSLGSINFTARLVDKSGNVLNGETPDEIVDYAYPMGGYTVDSTETGYSVKAGYRNTIAAAAQCGVELKPLDTADISTIRLYANLEMFDTVSGEMTDDFFNTHDGTVTVSDPEEIAQVYGSIKEYTRMSRGMENPYFYEVEVTVRTNNGTANLYYTVDASALPGFVYERMEVKNPFAD